MNASGCVLLDLSALVEPSGWIDPAAVRNRACWAVMDLPPGGAVQVLLGTAKPLPALVANELLEELENAEVGSLSILGMRADAVGDLVRRVNARSAVSR